MFSAVSLNFSRLIRWDFAVGSSLAAAAVLHVFLNISLFWKSPAKTHFAKHIFSSYNIVKTTYISIFYKNNEFFSRFYILIPVRYFAHFYRILLSFSGHSAVMHRASCTFLRRLRKYKKLEENAPPLCYNIAIKKKAAKAAEKERSICYSPLFLSQLFSWICIWLRLRPTGQRAAPATITAEQFPPLKSNISTSLTFSAQLSLGCAELLVILLAKSRFHRS